MIETILDLENQRVQVDKLNEMSMEDLKLIREEIRLISNRTPEFEVIEGSMKNYLEEDYTKVTGFESLWAHVNIAITKR